jgi:hypothetical protein
VQLGLDLHYPQPRDVRMRNNISGAGLTRNEIARVINRVIVQPIRSLAPRPALEPLATPPPTLGDAATNTTPKPGTTAGDQQHNHELQLEY